MSDESPVSFEELKPITTRVLAELDAVVRQAFARDDHPVAVLAAVSNLLTRLAVHSLDHILQVEDPRLVSIVANLADAPSAFLARRIAELDALMSTGDDDARH
jgi:hypothetical protein